MTNQIPPNQQPPQIQIVNKTSNLALWLIVILLFFIAFPSICCCGAAFFGVAAPLGVAIPFGLFGYETRTPTPMIAPAAGAPADDPVAAPTNTQQALSARAPKATYQPGGSKSGRSDPLPPAPTQAPADAPVEPAPVNAPANTSQPVGVPINLGDHELTVLSVGVQGELVIMELTIKNLSDKDITISTIAQFNAKDGNGRDLEVAYLEDACTPDIGGTIIPGDISTGFICWKTPETDQMRVYYSPALFEQMIYWDVKK